MWRIGSVRAVAGQDLHDPVLAGELQLLDAFLLDLLFGREMRFAPGTPPAAARDHVLFVVAPELGIPVEQRLYQILVLFAPFDAPRRGKLVANMRQNGLSTRVPDVTSAGPARPATPARRQARACPGRPHRPRPAIAAAEPRDDAATRVVGRERPCTCAAGTPAPIGRRPRRRRRSPTPRVRGGERRGPERLVRRPPDEAVAVRSEGAPRRPRASGASSTAQTTRRRAPRRRPRRALRASSTAAIGRPPANAMPFASARPMRSPVNEPGPIDTASAVDVAPSRRRRARARRSTSAGSDAAVRPRASRSTTSATTSSSRATPTVAVHVAVSMPRTSRTVSPARADGCRCRRRTPSG